MARKKAETSPAAESAIMSIDDMFSELTKDSEFVMADTGSLMHSCKKVTTPLYVLNCIYGGGVPLGVMTEISGPPSSGKSTFSYQCLGNYQREYPNGIPVVYDMEASMDVSRLEVLGVNTHRLLRKQADTIDKAFAAMFKVLNEIVKLKEKNPDITTFQIYDSLSSGGTEKQHEKALEGESAFNAGSMMEAPRIIKQNLSNVMSYFEHIPMFLGLVNQVFMQGIGSYVPRAESGGGFGLKHLCHAHIKFDKGQEVYEGGFLKGNMSKVTLEKSKLSPKFIDIPCYIDATNGGKIAEVESLVQYLTSANVNMIQIGSWYKMDTLLYNMSAKYPQLLDSNGELIEPLRAYTKSFRKNEMYDAIKADKDLVNLLQVALIDFIDDIYPMQRLVNGDYQKQLMDECIYFNYTSDDFSDVLDDSDEVDDFVNSIVGNIDVAENVTDDSIDE